MTVETFNNLITQEREELAHCEAVIDRGRRVFVEVGQALTRIRDGQLYREKFATFELYCEERWGISRPRAYQLIDAAAIAARVSTTVDMPAPSNERQVRPLSKLEPELQGEAWQLAVNSSEDGQPTSRHVEAAARQVAEQHGRPMETEDDRARALLDDWRGSTVPAAAAPEAPPTPEAKPAKAEPAGDEWYTRPEHIASVEAVMGGIDLDPASCAKANATVGALEYFGLDNGRDGLAEAWAARRLFLNPPYSNAGAWVAKLVEAFELGLVEEAILLVNANTSSAWFDLLWEHSVALCFVRGRVSFIAGERDKSATGWSPSVFVYLGEGLGAIAREFRQYGRIARAWPTEEAGS